MQRIIVLIFFSLSLFCFYTKTFAHTALNETIVIMRHGEKPLGGYGQLTCQGLNRALALPTVLFKNFGKPDYIFAPDTHVQVFDGVYYSYVRPLATIEPTAIQLQMPVNTQYGYNSVDDLSNTLLSPIYRSATIFIAWEHLYAVTLAQNIINRAGGSVAVPTWPDYDYDSLYIINIDWSKTPAAVTFKHAYEGLDNQKTSCP